ncbi:MAG: MIP family channel protein [Nocardioides sp.]
MSDSSAVAAPGPGQKLTAEFLGTFVLVFFGVGSVVILGASGHQVLDYTGIALAFGIAVMVMVYAVGRISGGHFNPAVSMGAAIGGRVSWNEALAYMVTQVVGAIVGAFALFVVAEGFPDFTAKGRMGANAFGSAGSGISWWAALVLELILTAIFVFVILAVTDSRNEHPALAPLAIGFTLVAVHLVAIPATGTSVNPARSIGPALFGGSEALQQVWLFIVAPLLGGGLSGIVYPLLFGHADEPVAGSGLRFGTRPPGAVPGYGAPDQFQQQWQQEGTPPQHYGAGQPPAAPAPPPPAPPAGPDDDGRTQIRPQQ